MRSFGLLHFLILVKENPYVTYCVGGSRMSRNGDDDDDAAQSVHLGVLCTLRISNDGFCVRKSRVSIFFTNQ